MTKKKKGLGLTKTNISYIILSVFLICLGIFNLVYPYIGMEDLLFFTSMIFLLFAFVTLLCYLWSRKDGDYELLLLTITNIIVGVFLYLCREKNIQVILGTAVLAFFVQAIAIKVRQILYLKKKEDDLFFPKLTIAVLLSVLTLLVVFNLYTGTTVQTMLFGYYFIVYGILWLLDCTLGLLVKTKKVKKFLNSKK